MLLSLEHARCLPVSEEQMTAAAAKEQMTRFLELQFNKSFTPFGREGED